MLPEHQAARKVTVPVRARAINSVDSLRDAVRNASGGFAIKRLQDKQNIRGRFMADPDDPRCWVQYTEHYDSGAKRYYPCVDDGTCVGCADGERQTKRFLVQFLDYSEKTVVALMLPTGLVDELLQKYDKFHTLVDRVYDIGRTGSGIKDTKYSVDYEEPKRFDYSRFELLDLLEILNKEIPTSDAVVNPGDDDEDFEQEPAPKQRAAAEPDELDDDDFAPPARPATVKGIVAKKAAGPPPATAAKRVLPAAPAKKILRRPGA